MAEHMLAREMGLIVGPALNALFGSVNVRLTDSIVLTGMGSSLFDFFL